MSATPVNRHTRQPERVLLGHCPECKRVVVVENNLETWPLVECACGWAGSTQDVEHRQRYDRGGYVEGDPEHDPRSARPVTPMHGPLVEVIDDYLTMAQSGVMRVEYEVLGGHVHCKVFGPFSGKAGDLVLGIEEWAHFRETNPGWLFRGEWPEGVPGWPPPVVEPGDPSGDNDDEDSGERGGVVLDTVLVLAVVLLLGLLAAAIGDGPFRGWLW